MSRKLPSVVGLKLDRARQVLAEAGGEIEQVEITSPPLATTANGDEQPSGTDHQLPEAQLRVVQARPGTGKKVCLAVTRAISLEAGGDSPANSGNGHVSAY